MWTAGLRFARTLGAGLAIAFGMGVAGPASAESLTSLAEPSARSPIASDSFYFVMTDRYRDGDPSNNTGGTNGPASTTGFDPASDAYFHGGDLAGLTGTCDQSDPNDDGLARIKRLGFTAIWVTPPFVQRAVQGDSAAYHGYWFLDLSRPDPRLGDREDFRALVDCAHRLGMKVFVDVVVNHTADVIGYEQGAPYVPIGRVPYRTAAGRSFNPWSYASGTDFPRLSADRSFAKTPQVDDGFTDAKVPAVLNDVTRYHNRGDIDWSSCVGRCEMDGDFAGLDDLMTEDWRVVKALAQAYGDWIRDFGIDGFRIDTARHVDPYFFGRWLPEIDRTALAAGVPGFTTFGEVWLDTPAELSEMMLDRSLPSVLDFPFQDAARQFATGQASAGLLAALFDEDDYYTSATTNAYGLTTFLGNHDMGRIGFFLTTQSQSQGDALTQRALLAHDLLYLTRGVPVVYYGDEVGMTGSGDGRDRTARQDMFPTRVAAWQDEQRIGRAPIGTGSSFDVDSPISERIAELSSLREGHPALASGAMITRYSEGDVLAVSRVDAATRTEYVVAFNGADTAERVVIPTSTPSTPWTSLLAGPPVGSREDGTITVTVPPRSTVAVKALRRLPAPATPQVTMTSARDFVTGRYVLKARVPGADPSSVTFLMRRAGGDWEPVGTDDARPFRVFVPPLEGGRPDERVQVAAVVTDSMGRTAATDPMSRGLTPFL